MINTDSLPAQAIRWLLALIFIIAGLWALHLSLFHWWAGGGPPTAIPAWHSKWSRIFFAVSVGLFVSAGLVIRLLRKSSSPP